MNEMAIFVVLRLEGLDGFEKTRRFGRLSVTEGNAAALYNCKKDLLIFNGLFSNKINK